MTVTEGQLLWEPSSDFVENAGITKYIAWLKNKNIIHCENYEALWQWSIDETEDFWASIWDYFEVISDTPYTEIVSSLEMKSGNEWFKGSTVNYAEHIMRQLRPGKIALHHLSEIRPLANTDGAELASKIRILATAMRAKGVKFGDAVCCLMPNIPETVIAMLASISIGALWSNAAPEFGSKIILDRFGQINPKWLFVADGYSFGGKPFDRSAEIKTIVESLGSSLEQVIYLPYLNVDSQPPVEALLWDSLFNEADPGEENFAFERVAHDHPLWVVFSSGTTGLPKAIVHSHVGALIELLKLGEFHLNLNKDSVAFFYTTTGWVMFNLMVSKMLNGSSIVLYDGNPAYPQPDVLWKMAADTGTTLFGASPTYVQVLQNLGIEPGKIFDLSKLNSILVGGAPSTPETFEWFYKSVKSDLWVTSQSGGTEIVSGFVGATPTQPVYAGEIQTRTLGMAVECWDENRNNVVDEVGELICTKPFPSMPIYFLNDDNNERYNASYFEDYPGVWRHGDFLKINQRGGCYIYGRSDSTLNRYGVRIGTAEVYRALEVLPEIADSLVVCIELPGGNFFMPLFVQLTGDNNLNEALIAKIKKQLREVGSPRHVPDIIHLIDQVPYTLTGKKMEVPVRKLLLGFSLEKVCSRDIMKNPDSLDYFLNYVATTQDYDVPKIVKFGT
jgi:acetoacetyl-CoA synthetase